MMGVYLNIRQHTDRKSSKVGYGFALLKKGNGRCPCLISVLFMVASLLFPVAGYGFGLEVDPVEIVIEDVPLGERVAVSELGGEEMKLRIQNKGTIAYTYMINVLSSSEANSRLREGYIDIADTSWIIPQNKEVRIPANSTKAIELYLRLPEEEEYYNKKYQAIIEVKSKKNNPQDMFVLAVQVRMRFSTIKTEMAK